MNRDSCTLYLGYPVHSDLKWMLERPFLLEYLSHLEFKGISYLAKSCGSSVTPADLEMVADHLHSLIEKNCPEASLDKGQFVLFPIRLLA